MLEAKIVNSTCFTDIWLSLLFLFYLFFLPKLIILESEKLPLGLAPPTIRILPFPPSPEGINTQV